MRYIFLLLLTSAHLFAHSQELDEMDQKVTTVLNELRKTRHKNPTIKCLDTNTLTTSLDWKEYEITLQDEKVRIKFPKKPYGYREITIEFRVKKDGVYYTLRTFDPSWKIHDPAYLFQKVLEGVRDDSVFFSSNIYKANGYDVLEYLETGIYEFRTMWIVTPYNVYILDSYYTTDVENHFGYFVNNCKIDPCK